MRSFFQTNNLNETLITFPIPNFNFCQYLWETDFICQFTVLRANINWNTIPISSRLFQCDERFQSTMPLVNAPLHNFENERRSLTVKCPVNVGHRKIRARIPQNKFENNSMFPKILSIKTSAEELNAIASNNCEPEIRQKRSKEWSFSQLQPSNIPFKWT